MHKKIITLISLLTFSFATEQAMIVLDASGSMMGKVDNKAKITIAKDTLNKVVNDWDENISFGLMAYGHRKKGDCSDIEVLIPISKIDKELVLQKVKDINPKGKTPISDSLKQAADKLRYTEDKATVILISDGKETCDEDPCKTAKELKSKGVDFVAHVIGFNVDTNTDKQLECIAKATGGEYFSAKNTSELNSAMKKAVKKVVKKRSIRAVRVKKPLKYNIVLTASEVEGGEKIDTTYNILKEGVEDYEPFKTCTSMINISSNMYSCKGKLPAGDYIVRVEHYPTFIIDKNITVKDDEKSELHVVVGSPSELDVVAVVGDSDEPINANFQISRMLNGKQVLVESCASFNKHCKVKTLASEYIIDVSIPFGKNQGKTGTAKVTLKPDEQLSVVVPVD